MSITTKLGRMMNNLEGLLLIKLLDFLVICGLARSRDKLNNYISTPTVPIVTKLGRGVTYHEGVPPIESHDDHRDIT